MGLRAANRLALIASEAPDRQRLLGLLVVEAIFVATSVRALHGAHQTWKNMELPYSWRLGAIESAIIVGGFCLTATSLFVFVALQRPVPGAAIVAPLLLGAAVAAALKVAIFAAKRREREADNLALRRKGLPVRSRGLSWQAVALLSGFVWPVTVLMIASGMTAILPESSVLELAAAIWILIGFALWLLVGPYLVIRQWRRERARDADYWADFRRAKVARDASLE